MPIPTLFGQKLQKFTEDEFASQIKQKYPEYKDIPNDTLVQKIVTKYPEYQDKIIKKGSLSDPNMGSDVLTGIAKGAGSTLAGASELGNKMLSGAYNATIGKMTGKKALNTAQDIEGVKQRYLTPMGPTQKFGFGAEQAAEFLVPGFEEGKAAGAASALAEKLPGLAGKVSKSVLPVVAKSAASALDFAGRTAIQTGGDKKATSAAGAVGAFLPPVLKVGEKALGAAGKLASEALGITTGVDAGAIKQAFRDDSREFVRALRGNVEETTQNVLAQAKEGLHTIADDMRSEYRKDFEKLKDSGVELPIDDIKKKADDLLKGYGITKTPSGALDFSRSTIADKTEASRVQSLIEGLNDWGSKKGDLTPSGLDVLKKRLDDFYSPSSQARALVTSIRNDVKKKILSEVPEYEKMTKNYADTIGTIKEIEKGLSLGSRAAQDTAIRKLSSVLKDNNKFRQVLLQKLESATGKNLKGQIAGAALSGIAPKGFTGRVLAGGEVLAGGGALAHMINPALLLGIPLTSPRVVGELSHALGFGTKIAEQFAPQLNSLLKGLIGQEIKK